MIDTKKVWKKFIVLEGLDGSGTTTQKQLLTEMLSAKGFPAVSTFEPTSGAIGSFLRECLKGEIVLDPGTLAYLFAADRHEHLFQAENGIEKLLKKGLYVVCDRYFFSSLAYQSLSIPFERVCSINSAFPLPEYLFYLKIDPRVAMNRVEARTDKEIFETYEIQKKVAEAYEKGLDLYNKNGMVQVSVDATLPRERITEILFNRIIHN